MKLANSAWLGLVSAAAIVAMFLDFATYTSDEDPSIDIATTASIATDDGKSLDIPTFVIRGPGEE
ncbi:hypothetical protein N8E89_03910 [Phyllobacterium sp. A18/5-2]|uniref:hypothetical protein n=1 Tax=Phyllobacterium sp. A18/5-2 TaxID=2978392 RepID=UPI0021C5EC75|nr:hypothetical protein [Phyllobacterium sp. A18/5-2]UXN64938.1 hypothetical protein N8E89_03910 [Phyllobacterium sp. A18/5-2]